MFISSFHFFHFFGENDAAFPSICDMFTDVFAGGKSHEFNDEIIIIFICVCNRYSEVNSSIFIFMFYELSGECNKFPQTENFFINLRRLRVGLIPDTQ